MTFKNTPQTYGTITKTFHWLTALLIATAFPLGMIANGMPQDTSAQAASKVLMFSLHKTVGIAVFWVALLRILWAFNQPKPAPLNAGRRAETFLAELVHWALYISLVAVPLSGWVHHAATTGFAPIWWPFGQGLPFMPRSPAIAATASAVHVVFTKILLISVLLHILGAFKHHLIDRDATLLRMLPGRPALPALAEAKHSPLPLLAALAIYTAGAAFALTLTPAHTPAPVQPPVLATPQSGWQVEDGQIAITIRQMGSTVTGSFADWTAAISFDEDATAGQHGTANVTISIPSLTLGSVSEQAKGAEFFDAAQFPAATFNADLLATETGYLARGTLDLKGAQIPVDLPFTLHIEGDSANMTGQVTLDRRDFAIGQGYTDAATLGFEVIVDVSLSAHRAD